MNRLLFKPNLNILEIDGKVMLALRNDLNTAPDTQNWRAFVALLDRPYCFKPYEIEGFAMSIYKQNESPAEKLLMALGARGMTVQDLVNILDKLRLERILRSFKHYEPIVITKQPMSEEKLEVGDVLVLSVEATGFPYPRYQWFIGVDEIPGATSDTLRIKDVSMAQTGWYCCRLHNCENLSKVVFTEHTEVKVYPPVRAPVYHDENDLRPVNCPTPIMESSGTNGLKMCKGEAVCNLPVIYQHPRDYFVFPGGSFHLMCEARGRPPLHYTWFRDGKYVLETQSHILQVDGASHHHSGKYHCFVQNSFGEVKSNPAFVSVSEGDKPQFCQAADIIEHPKSCTVEPGGHCLFVCKVQGSPPIAYQWLKDGIEIIGEKSPELRLHNIQAEECQGMYQCLVGNSNGQKLSSGAFLQISWDLTVPRQHFYATDKVALLIGNYTYRSENNLTAPKTDIQLLSEIFRVLNFKVVSLLNLTLTEMRSAIEEFCELLDEGVYGVFYFCGHGFEENNQCYLVPEDAATGFTTEDCLCADFALERMQRKNPKICCMILDICRRQNNVPNPVMSNIVQRVTTAGNTVICFATSYGCSAYEVEHLKTGILVLHLQKHLRKSISIDSVFSLVKTDIGKAQLGVKQIPEIKSNLSEERSFVDKILYRGGGTEAFNHRQLIWENAHKKPASQNVIVEPRELGIELELDFQSEFSNVLNIFVTVRNLGKTTGCLAWISKVPNTVSCMDAPVRVSEDFCHFPKTKNVIQDIQKLKENLIVSIAVKYRRRNSLEEELTDKTTVDLGLPLVAEIKLWRPRNMSQIRQPTEQMEDAASDVKMLSL